ncbi:nucleoside deaminase [Streptomyces sp. NPDC012935]|uniref:nucleoside deaminase n=1 Tax=Streptomyces sp. NPDC012935 TaxID=3364857 RepID=UPI00369B73B0
MDSGRRQFLGRCGIVVAGAAGAFALPRRAVGVGHAHPDTRHERFMERAIEHARRNPEWPFGAVIVDNRTGEVLGSGVNSGADNPMLHGEVVAMNDYVHRHGNQGWSETTLYTTGEPCSMCMSAMAWANLRRIVWGSSIDEIRRTEISQIDLSAREVADSARSFYRPELLLGGVLADRTNRLFREAQLLRRTLPVTVQV